MKRGIARLPRAAARFVPAVAVVCAAALLGAGRFASWATLGWLEAAGVALLLLAIARACLRAIRRRATATDARLRDELELGSTLIAAAYVLVAIGGAPLFPVVYLVMAILVGFLSRNAALALLGIGLVLLGLVTLPSHWTAFTMHAAFLTLFGALYHLVLSARISAARQAERAAVANRIKEVEERARTYRLVSPGTRDSAPGGVAEHEKWLVASVKEIDGALGSAIEIAEAALGTHTCAVFLLASDDLSLKLYDCRSASDRVQRERFPSGEGLLGGVLKRSVAVRMHSPTGLKGVTYYDEGAERVGAVLAVPILEAGSTVRGVLVADRTAAVPFTDQDEKLLSAIAVEVWRAVEIERVMGYFRRSRDEKDRFFRAIEEMNRAGAPEQVFLAVLEAARQIASLDFCAVTLVSENEGKRTHRIARLSGVTAPGRAAEGKVFPDNNGLVANVVRYGTPLPGRDVRAMDRQMIFDADVQVRGLSSLKIFPLVAGDRILGTLVCGSRRKAVMDDEALRMLEVIAIQAAQAVLRAQLFEQMELMATTDGLTGLLNHRSFQAKLDEALAQARRYGRRCSLILVDVDHFKNINDTHGHPAGDQVLKSVARVLRDQARDTDIVARYGGEEFAIVMPETDAKGAHVIAERIREAVQGRSFLTEMGPVKATVSLGVATCPDDASEKRALVELADQCLYRAKRGGRNRVGTATPGRDEKRLSIA